MPLHRIEFDSWHAWIDHCISPCAVPMPRRRSQDDNDRHWFGVSFAGAVKYASNGWPDGISQARVLTDPLVEKVSQSMVRYEPQYTVEGTGALDIGRYLDCEPECWVEYIPQITDGPSTNLLTIVFNGFNSCGIGAEAIIAKGATVAALVNLLELAGRRVRFILAYGQRDGRYEYEAVITLKDFDQPLDLDRLVYAIAHPSAFRRLCFSANEHAPQNVRRELGFEHGHYGTRHNVQIPCDLSIDAGVYNEPQWSNAASATKWVIEQLKAQGVVMENAT
jgi:hypothetical protein